MVWARASVTRDLMKDLGQVKGDEGGPLQISVRGSLVRLVAVEIVLKFAREI